MASNLIWKHQIYLTGFGAFSKSLVIQTFYCEPGKEKQSKRAAVLPVEDAPVAELLLGRVRRGVIVKVHKLWQEIFYDLGRHD